LFDIDMEIGRAAGGRDPRDRGLGSLTTWQAAPRTRQQMLRTPVPPQGSTNGVTQQSTFQYDAVLPPLTAEQQEALATRRRLATRGVEETQEVVARERARAEADAFRQEQDIARQQQLQSREGMQTLASRGVARSPMFANPFQRRLAEESQRQVGALQSGLAATLAQLQSALRQSEIARDRELAQIDFDATTARSNIGRLLGEF